MNFIMCHLKCTVVGKGMQNLKNRINQGSEKSQAVILGCLQPCSCNLRPLFAHLNVSDSGRRFPYYKDIRMSKVWRQGVIFCPSRMGFIRMYHDLRRFCGSCLCMDTSWGNPPEGQVQSFQCELQFWWQKFQKVREQQQHSFVDRVWSESQRTKGNPFLVIIPPSHGRPHAVQMVLRNLAKGKPLWLRRLFKGQTAGCLPREGNYCRCPSLQVGDLMAPGVFTQPLETQDRKKLCFSAPLQGAPPLSLIKASLTGRGCNFRKAAAQMCLPLPK